MLQWGSCIPFQIYHLIFNLGTNQIANTMQLDPISVTGNSEPLYFGQLAGYDTEELDRKGLDHDKKITEGFKWLPKTDSKDKATENEGKVEQKSPLGPPVKAWDNPPPTPEQGKTKDQGLKLDPDVVPSWDEFTQTTTFHGVRYIFDKSPNKLRR